MEASLSSDEGGFHDVAVLLSGHRVREAAALADTKGNPRLASLILQVSPPPLLLQSHVPLLGCMCLWTHLPFSSQSLAEWPFSSLCNPFSSYFRVVSGISTGLHPLHNETILSSPLFTRKGQNMTSKKVPYKLPLHHTK